MAIEGWNVKQKYHIFMEVLHLYCSAVFGINIVYYFTARNMGSFKSIKCFLLLTSVQFHGLQFVF